MRRYAFTGSFYRFLLPVYTINLGLAAAARGVALVRDISVTPVPVPPSLGMFGFGLFALGVWRRKVNSKTKI